MRDPAVSRAGHAGPGAAVPRRSWALAALLGTILLGALALLAHRNLPYAVLWYDEAVQFWTSRGIDPFRAPGDPAGGIAAVVRMNGRANLDPGGFSLLLHAWMTRALDPAWLRTLPFAFFLAGLGAMGGLAWAWRRSPAFAVLGGALPLAYPLLLHYATEVRAYTMEFAGIALGCLLVHRLQTGAGAAGFAVAGLTLAAFMGSRYSYSIFAGAAGLALLPVVWPRSVGARRAQWRRLFALGAPLLGGVLCLALALWIQRGRITHQGGALLDYMSPAMAAGQSLGHLARAAVRNLLSPVALPVTLATIIALVPARGGARGPGALLGLGARPESRLMYRLAAWTLVLSVVLWRWHPWDVRYKWSLYLHALSAVMALRLVADVLAWADARAWSASRVRMAGTLGTATLAVGLSLHTATVRRTHTEDMTGALRQLEGAPLAAGSVAVGTHAYPGLRYLCEHGPFVGRVPYPAAFRLPSWGGPRPLIGPDTRYMIAFERPDVLARLHGAARFRAEPGWPPNLYAVIPGTSGEDPGGPPPGPAPR